MARVYYINYLDPRTGFLKRIESEDHRIIEDHKRALRASGVKHFNQGSFER